MDHPGIEFSAEPDDTESHTRHFFRVPLQEHDASIFISGFSHRVSEISQTGICLLLEDSQTYEIGERLYPCRLRCADILLTDLTGKIVHCSPHDDFWKFGIQWIEMNDSHKQQMDQIVSILKKRVMATSLPTIPEDTGREK